MYAPTPSQLLATQAPQVLALTYLGTSGVILPCILEIRRTVRGRLRWKPLLRLIAFTLMTLMAIAAIALLVFLVPFLLSSLIYRLVFVTTALGLVVNVIMFAWPLRRRTLRWLLENPATETIDDARLQVLADRHAIYAFGRVGMPLVFLAISSSTAAAYLARPDKVTSALALEIVLMVLGSSAVALCVLETLRRIFPDAELIEVYRRGAYTTHLVDLCDRCLSREIGRAPETLRNAYQPAAEGTLAALAKELHRTESDTASVRSAVHDALEPSLSLGGQEVVHRLGSGTPSLRTDLTKLASALAITAGVVGSIKVLVEVAAPLFG